ncbi:glycosyltransferase [Achromobacter ruhlandii]|uniref:Spore protein YkvP/CgeB glycosyl transferase-like domain-containing protein n=2 Tax=Achromobacter ruhlandii TaxID=72557 RepID=A0ABM8M2C5_9BURK|nr:glycosyltransferase [Achromobacter ruhlandii]AKP90555.1 Glycosyl transferase, group 1 [Achromobacter xylosoxidans]AOU93794.1 glycosyl transferase [Achromobacter ruhlandii]MCZ8432924.1 glycosyltransferase [Achromobacter ruhlandii]MDC6092502.1 glycosyltransferase [Achromobacter ruhlandii]MDC6152078.1 glycosyltransferase [Achromobacter ruhlandii]
MNPTELPARRLRILTWHVHGNYLYALGHVPHDFVVPRLPGDRPGYGALGNRIPWGANMAQVPATELQRQHFDCVLYQSRQNLDDARLLLSDAQRALPCAYLEHNPPEPHPTDTPHPFRHDRGLLVHVTPFNAEMWDNGAMPVRVVEHGVPPPDVVYDGSLARGIVVVNHLARRGRRIGRDVFERMRARTPLDLIGMGSASLGGLGEVPNMEVAACLARYRYFFSPVRYASLGLSLVEAMLCGVPVVGFATTELPTVITNGRDGYVDTRLDGLVEVARQLLDEPALARAWGAAGRQTALRRFGMARFVADWLNVFDTLMEAA